MTIHTDNKIAHFDSQAYKLLDKIGEGGFGQVYRAKQVTTGQIVAIKFLSVSSDFDEAKKKRYVERFERETILGSRLQHPNIVRLLDKGCYQDDLLYAVFEYVDGLTLKQTLAENGTLLPNEAAEVMAQVLDALSHAHEQGVIHRDIKPANIMLTKVGAKTHVKVLDFGIGTLVNDARKVDYKSITLTQETLGTPSYSAPEQLRGEPPTSKTDIYVWGLVFIECLTGQPAVTGSSLASVFHKQLSPSNVPLPAAIAGHPVSGLLRRVLNKKSADRAANAAELYIEFNQFNFSTLVGDLSGQIRHDNPDVNTRLINVGENETIINDTKASYTNLTERKQITALCINLSVKAIAKTEIDHEVVDALHRDQKAQCVDIAIRYGAFHVGTLGDTLLFYFGYPTVSDNDSRLAARTALEISSQLNKRNSLLKKSQGIEVMPQMGMHTGVITNYVDTTPEGETANIAMVLARLAKNNQVLCTDTYKKLLDTYLQFQAQETCELGISQQQTLLYSLAAERQVEAFGFLRANRNNHAFIGRENEFTALQNLIIKSESQYKVAHIFGEAGIGKSRLVFEFRKSAKKFEHYVAQCLPEHKNNALYPILSIIKYKYALDALTAENAVTKLRNEISKFNDILEQDAIPVLCSWLALSLPEDLTATAYSPDIQKQILFKTLTRLLINDTLIFQQLPSLILFEDMHWADPTSIEFIAHFIADKNFISSNDIFINTSREPLPELLKVNEIEDDNKQQGKNSILILELLKLSQASTSTFVLNLFDNKTVSPKLLDLVVTRTDGIPLFIEELVNMLLQKNLVQHLNGITDFVNPDKINEVPGSLRDSLQQKLDTLIYAKETAQLAATIGREFDYALLAAASNRSEAQLQIDLNELVEAELVYLQRKVAGDSYIFKHALVRDAAYDSMVTESKIRQHGLIGQTLEQEFNSITTEMPYLVAEHYAKANDYRKSCYFGIKDISRLLAYSSHHEVINNSQKVEIWISKLDGVFERLNKELELKGTILPSIIALNGYGGQKVVDISARIRELISSIEDNSGVSGISSSSFNMDAFIKKCEWTLFMHLHYSSQRDEARNIGESIVNKCTDSLDDRAIKMVILSHLAQAYAADGDLLLSADAHQSVISMHDERLIETVKTSYGSDAYSQNLSMSSLTYLAIGNIDLAIENNKQSFVYSKKSEDDISITFSHLFTALISFFCGQKEPVNEVVNLYSEKYPEKIDKVWFNTYLFMLNDWAKCQTSYALNSIEEQINSGQEFALACYEPSLAETYLALGQKEKAHELMNNSLIRCENVKNMFSLPYTLYMNAKCEFENTNVVSSKVACNLLKSMELSRSQSSYFFLLCALQYYLFLNKTGNLNIIELDKCYEELEGVLNKIVCSIDLEVITTAKTYLNTYKAVKGASPHGCK